ncbi:adenylate kinase 4, mitochondrial [Leucoraja erinacea]|uniref:adenylate kinase 4, mitochondrial n=1 Tax=Leucoraja erinaceus TaxID=7782 RepID=UPI002453F287|nr:adenylate kinase 4, mitochondrial [Leucoraja erinacea]
MASKILRAAILGAPGSGKGTISERITKCFGLKHLSSGDFLRSSVRSDPEIELLAKRYLERGYLVPDHVTTHLMLEKLKSMGKQSWLLDGFPHTLAQAEALNGIYQLDLVIHLNVPFETLKERLRARWVHLSSGRVYNMTFNPPLLRGIDDITGDILIQRDDDKLEVVAFRLRQYKDITKPVIDLYRTKGILHTFSGTETDKIWPYIHSLLSARIPALNIEAPIGQS